jgi:hypothetical protein
MRKFICLLVAAMAISMSGAARAEAGLQQMAQASPAPSGQKLVGLDAWNQLVGNSITGTEDGETLVEYYAADGTTKSMLGNQISTGQWVLVGDTVCFKYPDEEMDCYKLEVMGNTVTMTDSTGEATRYEILKGNRKSL